MTEASPQPPKAPRDPVLHTIGYGARSLAEVIALLGHHRIEFLLDVRSAPYSKFKPEFSKQPLEAALRQAGIRYVFMGDTLGGQPTAPNCLTAGKVDYEKVRRQPAFRSGIERLRKAHDQGRRVALLCSEQRPEQCHRSLLIGVALAKLDLPVWHIDEEGRLLSQAQVMDRVTGGQLDLAPGEVPPVGLGRSPTPPPGQLAPPGMEAHGSQEPHESPHPARRHPLPRGEGKPSFHGKAGPTEGNHAGHEPNIVPTPTADDEDSSWENASAVVPEHPPATPPPTLGGIDPEPAIRLPSTETIDPARARVVLKQTFGFSEFLPLQAEVVERLLRRKDTLVVMPTGGGKSLCYQLPAMLFDGLTVVVSPLIALMQDQVSQMHELGVPAAFLNSTLASSDYGAITRQVRSGEVKILYVAPETLLRPDTIALLRQSRTACLAVDEAHCISEWGHDFRPEYRQLQAVRERFPHAVCVALTATATPRVREDIQRLLGIPRDGEFVASFDRANLSLSVLPRADGLGQVLAFLEEHRGQSGIIYSATRKQVDQLAAELEVRQWPARPYHAGLDTATRRRHQDDFIRSDDAIMVATIAFGMGINKSNVRFVVHYNLPKDIESYYQEIGRSGRDGLPADCLLLHSRRDAITIRRFIDEGAASEAAGRQARLDAMIRYAETSSCRRVPLLGYFGETHEGGCGHCDNCLSEKEPAERTDVTEAAQKFLSCVKRTGEIFGAAHIIDVLRGSQSQRVLDRRHDRLSTHGIGQEFSKEVWRDLAQQFLEQGLLEQDLQHGGLRLTAKSWKVLKGEPVLARLKPAKVRISTTKDTLPEQDAELFEVLRALRRRLADEANLPPYIIFTDRSLAEMAAHRPASQAQLLEISGVGQAKLAHYGEPFLRAIRDHCESRGLTLGANESSPTPTDQPATTAWLTGERRRYEVVGELFTNGKSLQEIAAQFGVKMGTVLRHLTTWQEAGNPLDTDRLLQTSTLSEADRQRVFDAFEEHGWERLGPVHEALGGAIPYAELHLLRLCALSRQG